jgi:PhnB protein
MAVKPIPEGHNAVSPYLVVADPARLIEFLKRTFDATELFRLAQPDGRVMHAEVKIADSVVMTGQASEQHPPTACMLHVYVTDADTVYKRALQAGATSIAAPEDAFYGDRRAAVRDAFGNQWWIATHKEDVPADEMKRREEAFMKQRRG